MSSSSDFFPTHLKWVCLGCLVVLLALLVVAYLNSPKQDHASDWMVEGLADNAEPTPMLPLQSDQATASASTKTVSPSSSASATTKSQSATVGSDVVGDTPAHIEAKDNTSQQAKPPAAPPADQPTEESSDTHCTKDKAKVFGVIIGSKKVYYAPRFMSEFYAAKEQYSSKIKYWFCSEKEALQAGWIPAISL